MPKNHSAIAIYKLLAISLATHRTTSEMPGLRSSKVFAPAPTRPERPEGRTACVHELGGHADHELDELADRHFG